MLRRVTIVRLDTRDVSTFSNEVPAHYAAFAQALGFASHQDALHLLGCFKFKILAQIAIGPGECNFLGVLWNLPFNQLFVFGLASFRLLHETIVTRFHPEIARL